MPGCRGCRRNKPRARYMALERTAAFKLNLTGSASKNTTGDIDSSERVCQVVISLFTALATLLMRLGETAHRVHLGEEALDFANRYAAAYMAMNLSSKPVTPDTTSAMGAFVTQILGDVVQASFASGQLQSGRLAIARGVKGGRHRALSAADETEVVLLYESGLNTLGGLGAQYGVSLSVVDSAVYRVENPNHSSLK